MKLIETTLSLLAPHSCLVCDAEGSVMCAGCQQQHLQVFGERCAGCNKLSPQSKTCTGCRSSGLPAHVWVSAVYTNVASRLVYKYKFDHQRECAKVMAGLMTETISSLSQYVVVPVPTATKRVRERGFDHAKLLGKQIAADLKLPYADVLGRVGQKSQVGASRSARMTQSQNKYYIKTPKPVFGRKILLIDDVITTGSTLKACAGLLRIAGAVSVDAAVFAKKV